MSEALQRAVEAWQSVVGVMYVSTDDAARITALFPTTQRTLAIIKPGDVDEVQQCVRIAQQYGFSLHPVSRGANYGLGSKVPPHDGQILLDLSRLDRIIAYDEKYATLTVQPGVTFAGAAAYLTKRRASHFLSVTGGPASGSVVGNTLARGHGVGYTGRRHRHILDMTVILPDGAVIQTGMSRFAGASTAGLYAYPPGPGLNELFVQSPLGIVVEMTVALQPYPEVTTGFSGSVPENDLPDLINALQPVMLRGILPDLGASIWNGYKFDRLNGQTPERQAGMRFILSGALYAESRAHAEALCGLISDRLSATVPNLRFGHVNSDSLLLGQPADTHLRGMTVRYTEQITPNDGLLWLCPVLPFDGRKVAHAVEVVERIADQHGFQPQIGLVCGTGRTVDAFVALIYDRRQPDRETMLIECHEAMREALNDLGHHLYRPGRRDPITSETLQNVLRSLRTHSVE